jgi:CheY-like chemotaxis protein
LNGVLGIADALARTELSAPQSHMLGLIQASAGSLGALLCDILDLARTETGDLPLHPAPFDPGPSLRTAAELFAASAHAKGLDFHIRVDPGLPPRLLGDSLRIRQVVCNLIDNAVKFTREGAVSVEVSAPADPEGFAGLQVRVRDTGPGMTADICARLFDRFQQGDGSATRYVGGAGLGLSIARNLARLMGGDVTCDSHPGEGSVFTFAVRLPIKAEAPTVEARKAPGRIPPASRTQERRPRVLLAEDHPTNQKVVQMMLGKAVDVVIAGDGREALEAVRLDRYDLILMDSQMPVMDGLMAMREIRKLEASLGRPRTPIISLTANAMAHQVEASMAAGADYHLSKPITMQGLLQTVRRALEESESAGKAVRRA